MKFEKMIRTFDTQVAGEIYRVIVNPFVEFDDEDIYAKFVQLKEDYKNELDLLMNEPRGHRAVNICVIIPSKLADFAMFLLNNDDELYFKYSSLAASIITMINVGEVTTSGEDTYSIETINGLFSIDVTDKKEVHYTAEITTKSVPIPSNIMEKNLNAVKLNGETYLVIDSEPSIPHLHLDNISEVIDWGREIVHNVKEQNIVFSGIIITNPTNDGVISATFEHDGNILRSAGIETTLALLLHLSQQDPTVTTLTNTSTFGSTLKATKSTNNIYTISVKGNVFSINQFIYQKTDPFKSGFLLK